MSQLTNRFQTLLASCTGVHCGLIYQHWYMKGTQFVNEKVVSDYCTHILQTKLMHKNLRHRQQSMFTATGEPIDVSRVVL
jgi:hypothetical protein